MQNELASSLLAGIGVITLIGLAKWKFKIKKPLPFIDDINYLLSGYGAAFIGIFKLLLGFYSKPWKRTKSTKSNSNYNQVALVSIIKRTIDIVGSIIGLVLSAPIMLLAGIAIKLSSKGPIFYQQQRVGKFEDHFVELFNVYKLRTMVADAEQKTGAVWASKQDSRITKDNIEMLRSPSKGISNYSLLKNKVSNKKILKGELITSKNFDRKILAIVVARSKSSRLKDKASLKVGSVSSLEHLFKRLEISKNKNFIDKYILCTTEDSSDNELAIFAQSIGVEVFRGDEENVLKRMMTAISAFPNYSTILRVTGDDILIEPNYLRKTIDHHFKVNADYTDAKLLPSGTEVEVFESNVLEFLMKWCIDTSGTEYLTNYITENSHLFDCASLPVKKSETVNARLTLDTKEDFDLINELIEYFKDLDKEFTYTLEDIVNYFRQYPEKLDSNKEVVQKKIPKKFSTEIDYVGFCSDQENI